MKRKTNKNKKPRKQKFSIVVEPKTNGQAIYIDSIKNNEITICNGKAGTGKTLLAVGVALSLLKENPLLYNRIVMIRPAITAGGEDLGYLPGGIDDKMMPFILPMLDSLKFYLRNSDVMTMMANGTVEISPISYMRGRTYNNCIMIFDEAQNSTIEQMKMVVTRIGFNTKLIIEGDVSQSDIINKEKNGLADVIKRFSGIDGIGICSLSSSDVVRSPILNKILQKY